MLRVRDLALNSAALCVLAGAMSLINRDVGRQLATIAAGDSVGTLASVSSHLEPVRLLARQLLGGFGSENDAMVAFGVVAAALVVAMFRS